MSLTVEQDEFCKRVADAIIEAEKAVANGNKIKKESVLDSELDIVERMGRLMENKNLYENISLDEAANLVVKRMREIDQEVIEECINKKEQEELGRLKNENNNVFLLTDKNNILRTLNGPELMDRLGDLIDNEIEDRVVAAIKKESE